MKHYLPAIEGFYVCELKGFDLSHEPVLDKHPVIAWAINTGEDDQSKEKATALTPFGAHEGATSPLLCPNGEVVQSGISYSTLNHWITNERNRWINSGRALAPWHKRRA
jgi:hypothetical protein